MHVLAEPTLTTASSLDHGLRSPRTEEQRAIPPKELQGKVCLITGGTRGIGRATLLALAERGADIAFTYINSKDHAQEVSHLAQSWGVRCHAFQANAASELEVERMAAEVIANFGAIDILVNNAGVARDKSFVKMTKAMWDEVLHTNLNGVFNTTHAVLPSMLARGWGRIINVASVVGLTGNFGQANYAASKAGAIAFTLSLAREVARQGITVNAVAPGFIETDMTKDLPDTVLEHVRTMTPIGRFGQPAEVAEVIAFLASPRAAYITGQVVSVNGGLYMSAEPHFT
jgi:3-oxoacyl-(acyl-carrier-protein) reductase